MERDFHRFLSDLTPDDRRDAITTFLHLLDKEELNELLQLAQSEQTSRSKREASRSSVKRQPHATAAEAGSSGLQQSVQLPLLKKVRIQPYTTPTALVSPVRSGLTPFRVPRRVINHTPGQNLLSKLIGEPEPDCQSSQQLEEVQTADLMTEEDELLMNSDDDAIVSMYEEKQDEAVVDAEGADCGEQVTQPSDQTAASDEAVGQFVTGRFRKVELIKNPKAENVFQNV